jgi:O-antigen ligase
MKQKARLQNALEKFHQKLFYLLVLLLPTQLGKHFWPQFAFVFGLPIDYLSPTVYLTDLLILTVLASWGLSNFKRPKRPVFFLSCLLFLLINVLLARSPGVGVYKLVKLAELFSLGFYIVETRPRLSSIASCLSWAVIYSSLIAIGQFLNREALGGLFWWLGERSFSIMTPGIARADFGGRLVLRPYSIFPHPNVLAGFLLVSLVLISVKAGQKRKKWLFWPAFILGLTAIFLSFSRAVWLTGLLLIGWKSKFLTLNKNRKNTMTKDFLGRLPQMIKVNQKFFLIIVVLGAVFYFIFFLFPLDSFSISRRLELSQSALLMIKKKPFFGVGLGNFLVQLPYFWQAKEGIRFIQPVHNIFLLVAAEAGLIGLMIFLWLVFKTFKKLLEINSQPLMISFLVILLTGMVDHYWLTLQQGQLLFTMVLGLAWTRD